jgi:DNA-binding MarR family transcriptional regulator
VSFDEERRGEDRRSPVGDFLLAALAFRGEQSLPYAELLQMAGDNGLNMSSVLAWAGRAEETGLIEQRPGPDGQGRELRLTAHGAELARNNRRRVQRRSQGDALSGDDAEDDA